MKPPVPLPTEPPFISFYTPTFRRPEALARCLRSVGRQTAVLRTEQIIIPDFVGHGVGPALYGRLPWYAEAMRGHYVHVLNDDDVLAADDVVARLEAIAAENHHPPVLVVQAWKNGHVYPRKDRPGAESHWASEVEGAIDVASYVLRRDIWLAFRNRYGLRYAGDADHVAALNMAGVSMVETGLKFVEGTNRNGRPEVEYQ